MKTSRRITGGPLTMLAGGVLLIGICLLQPAAVQAQWTTPDSNQNINNTNTGNVGVGTTEPNYKFDITNLLNKAQVRFGMGASDSGGFLYSGGPSHAVFSAGASYNDGWIAKSLSASMIEANVGQLTFYANQGISTGSPFTPTARMTITSGGNVGIGTTSPGARLVTFGNFLAGNITSHTQLYSTYDSQSNVIMELGYGTATADITPLASLVLSKNLTSTNNAIGVISFANSNIANGNEKRLSAIGTSTDGALNSGVMAFSTSSAGTLNERMRINSSGNVGIGTTTPSARFEVVGASPWIARFKKTDNSNGGIIIDSNTGYNPNVALAVNGANKWYLLSNASSSDALQFWEATGTIARFTLTQGGTVGIGTATPNASYKLDVAGYVRSSSGGYVFPDGTIQTTAAAGGDITEVTAGAGMSGGGTSGAVTLTNADRGSSQFIFKNIANSAGTTQFSAGSNSDSLRFQGNGGTTVSFDAATKKVVIDGSTSTISAGNISAGQFGQNTGGGNYTFPGNVTVNGNIAAKYQDVAEWVESSQELGAGTVVVLDSSKSNQVIVSTQAYDSRVAGVISRQPGIALGEQAEGRVLVATTGRVKMKVDASNGPIQIGDLLVTSEREGFAMKSVPVEIGGVRIHRPGTLIGKALESLAHGTGEILVLLSMQ